MPKRKEMDSAKLVVMVKEGTNQIETVDKMGLKTFIQLKTVYMKTLNAEGKIPAIKGSRGEGKADKAKEVCVGKRGSLIISKETVESIGISAKDKFIVRKS
jgi:hypothetical protein